MSKKRNYVTLAAYGDNEYSQIAEGYVHLDTAIENCMEFHYDWESGKHKDIPSKIFLYTVITKKLYRRLQYGEYPPFEGTARARGFQADGKEYKFLAVQNKKGAVIAHLITSPLEENENGEEEKE